MNRRVPYAIDLLLALVYLVSALGIDSQPCLKIIGKVLVHFVHHISSSAVVHMAS